MWSRIKSSLQQFWSNFIWSSTCKAKTDVGGITLGDSLTSHDGVSPSSSIWLTSWEQKCYQKLFIHKIAVLSWLNRALLKPLSIKYRIEYKYRIFTTDYIPGKQNYGCGSMKKEENFFINRSWAALSVTSRARNGCAQGSSEQRDISLTAFGNRRNILGTQHKQPTWSFCAVIWDVHIIGK